MGTPGYDKALGPKHPNTFTSISRVGFVVHGRANHTKFTVDSLASVVLQYLIHQCPSAARLVAICCRTQGDQLGLIGTLSFMAPRNTCSGRRELVPKCVADLGRLSA